MINLNNPKYKINLFTRIHTIIAPMCYNTDKWMQGFNQCVQSSPASSQGLIKFKYSTLK